MVLLELAPLLLVHFTDFNKFWVHLKGKSIFPPLLLDLLGHFDASASLQTEITTLLVIGQPAMHQFSTITLIYAMRTSKTIGGCSAQEKRVAAGSLPNASQ